MSRSLGLVSFTGVAALSLVLLAVACREPTESGAPDPGPTRTPTISQTAVPKPLSASASASSDNSLIARIVGTLDIQGLVYAEYWAEGVSRLRSKAVHSDGTNYKVHAVRLRANTRYSYQVFSTDPNGRVSEGPTGTFTTGALPEALQKARFFVLNGEPTHDLTYMEFQQPDFSGLVAIDGRGHIVWYYSPAEKDLHPQAMAQKPNGNIVYNSHKDGASSGLMEITPLGEEVDRLEDRCPPSGPMHHEVHLLRDGRVMYMSKYILRPGYGDPPAPQEADTIGIWDQAAGKSEIIWNMADFISPADRTKPESNSTRPGKVMWGGCNRDETVQDWSHGNSAFMADDGSVLVSLRHLDQIVSIAPGLQSLRWRLGGPGSDFTFPDPSDGFYHQHSAVPLPDNRVLLFDNGNRRPSEEGGQYSRALELKLDMETMTARKVWEYRHDPDIFAICCSNVHRLANGNTLMVFGASRAALCCRPFTIVEVDPAGDVVWEVKHFSRDKPSQYKVYPADSVMGEVLVPEE